MTTADEDSSGSNAGAVAGGITAGLLAVIAIVGGIVLCCIGTGLVVAGGGYAAKKGHLNQIIAKITNKEVAQLRPAVPQPTELVKKPITVNPPALSKLTEVETRNNSVQSTLPQLESSNQNLLAQKKKGFFGDDSDSDDGFGSNFKGSKKPPSVKKGYPSDTTSASLNSSSVLAVPKPQKKKKNAPSLSKVAANNNNKQLLGTIESFGVAENEAVDM